MIDRSYLNSFGELLLNIHRVRLIKLLDSHPNFTVYNYSYVSLYKNPVNLICEGVFYGYHQDPL